MSNFPYVTCVYCGHQYPGGTPESRHAILTEHICQCPKHPMRKLGMALCGLLEVPFPPSTQHLDGLTLLVTSQKAPSASSASDIRAVLVAIDALRVFVPNTKTKEAA
jgi:hypothetical protein